VVTERKVRKLNEKPFYSRRIGKAGATRTLSVGRILPSDWTIVKVVVEKLEGEECVLRITRLV